MAYPSEKKKRKKDGKKNFFFLGGGGEELQFLIEVLSFTVGTLVRVKSCAKLAKDVMIKLVLHPPHSGRFNNLH